MATNLPRKVTAAAPTSKADALMKRFETEADELGALATKFVDNTATAGFPDALAFGEKANISPADMVEWRNGNADAGGNPDKMENTIRALFETALPGRGYSKRDRIVEKLRAVMNLTNASLSGTINDIVRKKGYTDPRDGKYYKGVPNIPVINKKHAFGGGNAASSSEFTRNWLEQADKDDGTDFVSAIDDPTKIILLGRTIQQALADANRFRYALLLPWVSAEFKNKDRQGSWQPIMGKAKAKLVDYVTSRDGDHPATVDGIKAAVVDTVRAELDIKFNDAGEAPDPDDVANGARKRIFAALKVLAKPDVAVINKDTLKAITAYLKAHNVLPNDAGKANGSNGDASAAPLPGSTVAPSAAPADEEVVLQNDGTDDDAGELQQDDATGDDAEQEEDAAPEPAPVPVPVKRPTVAKRPTV